MQGASAMKAFYQSHPGGTFVGDMTTCPFPLHVHESIELSYIVKGDCTMHIDDQTYTLYPGDFAIAFPLVPHSFESLSTDIEGMALFFMADAIDEFSNTFHKMMPVTPVVRSADVPADALLALDRLSGMKGTEYRPTRMACLHLLLATLLSAMTLRPAETQNEKGLADRVIKYIFDHACENITLSSTAHGLGISESHLSHLFSQQFHINFRRFVNAIRIDKAEALMRDPDMTLTAICYSCGYENMRTFRRAFVRETGMLPTAYLQKMRGETPFIAPIDA